MKTKLLDLSEPASPEMPRRPNRDSSLAEAFLALSIDPDAGARRRQCRR